jgi:anti-anti-sigma regulatory factor
MADPNNFHIILNNAEWLDAPEAVLEVLKSVKSGTVTIDASAPDPIGAQVAQLLLAAKKTATDSNGLLKIEDASEAFMNSLKTLGLMTAFEELSA